MGSHTDLLILSKNGYFGVRHTSPVQLTDAEAADKEHEDLYTKATGNCKHPWKATIQMADIGCLAGLVYISLIYVLLSNLSFSRGENQFLEQLPFISNTVYHATLKE